MNLLVWKLLSIILRKNIIQRGVFVINDITKFQTCSGTKKIFKEREKGFLPLFNRIKIDNQKLYKCPTSHEENQFFIEKPETIYP